MLDEEAGDDPIFTETCPIFVHPSAAPVAIMTFVGEWRDHVESMFS
jgi:hypothetical protein